MTSQRSMVHVRVEMDIKQQATEVLIKLGLSVSDAVNLFLRRVVAEQSFPLELKVPNAATRTAIEESHALMASRNHSRR